MRGEVLEVSSVRLYERLVTPSDVTTTGPSAWRSRHGMSFMFTFQFRARVDQTGMPWDCKSFSSSLSSLSLQRQSSRLYFIVGFSKCYLLIPCSCINLEDLV
jgi:hypothetical protein